MNLHHSHVSIVLLTLIQLIHLTQAEFYVLKPTSFQSLIEKLELNYTWAVNEVPFFDINDPDLLEAYYFRWKSYSDHIVMTPDGYVITEFIVDVPWAKKYNAIPDAAGHHIYEGRWLHTPTYIDDYSNFWFSPDGDPRQYTFWAGNAIWNRYLVDGRAEIPSKLLSSLISNFNAWNASNMEPQGCFYQTDDSDAMEDSISGSGCRPTINSVMYAEMIAISSIAELIGNASLASYWSTKAAKFQQDMLALLWNSDIQFFAVYKVSKPGNEAKPKQTPAATCPPDWPADQLVTVRELLGLGSPYYFYFVPVEDTTNKYSVMWAQLLDTEGFAAKWGPRTAEHRAPCYNYSIYHECLWNAPSWPYETSRVLTGLANLLNDYPPQSYINATNYYALCIKYAILHTQSFAINGSSPWIGEDIHPDLGYWLARSILYSWNNTRRNRGKEYNHSSFCDLVISGLVGLRPSNDVGTFYVRPLIDTDLVDYFALDNVLYHARNISIVFDKTGTRYGMGRGLQVLCNGKLVAKSDTLSGLSVPLC